MTIPINSSLNDTISSNFIKTSNLNLLFNKFIYNWGENNSYKSINTQEFLIEISESFNNNAYPNRKKYEYFINGWKDTLGRMKNVTSLTANSLTRLAVGLGNETILENSITLHNTWGFPYIPGSAIKGATRAYYIAQISAKDYPTMNQKDIDEQIALPKNDFSRKFPSSIQDDNILFARRIFGTQDEEGAIIFFDAFPTKFPLLKVDIMNPHFSNYYSNKNNDNPPPGDWENPVPIYFMTVAENQEFLFSISIRDIKKLHNGDAEKLKVLIQGVLTESGLGAKTSVGYGFFTKISFITIDHPEDPVKPEKKLSEIDQLAHDIRNIYSDNDVGKFYNERFNQYSDSDQKILAQALKEYYEKNGKWSGSKVGQKQKNRVNKIKAILGE